MLRESLVRVADPLPPVRGLVPAQNARAKPFPVRHIHRWLHLIRTTHKIEKVDLLVRGPIPSRVEALIHYCTTNEFWRPECPARPVNIRLSLRTDCPEPPDTLFRMRDLGLLDVYLCPPSATAPNLQRWLDACGDLEIPVRMQLTPPLSEEFDVAGFCDRAANAGVAVVNLVLHDPFIHRGAAASRIESAKTVAEFNELARALMARGIEVNIYGLPLCHLDADLRDCAGGSARFFLDHQQYHRGTYKLAEALYRRHPSVAGLALAFLLIRNRSYRPPNDAHFIHWLMVKNRRDFHSRALVWSKLARGLGFLPGDTCLLEDREHVYIDELEESARVHGSKVQGACRDCALRRDRKSVV